MIRRRVLFTGRVQGVGFRATTQAIARAFEVRGYVRNLPDGSVELVAEGEPAELDLFLQRLESDMGRNIRDSFASEEPATGAFSRFEIAY